jgi:hypothetical protein
MNLDSFIISILFATIKEHETQLNNFLFLSISTKSWTLHNGNKPLNRHLTNKNTYTNIYLLTPTTNTIITIPLPPFIWYIHPYFHCHILDTNIITETLTINNKLEKKDKFMLVTYLKLLTCHRTTITMVLHEYKDKKPRVTIHQQP